MARSVPRRFLPAVAFALLLLVVSLLPAPEAGRPIPVLLGVALDKWVHAGSYAVLAWLLARARGSRTLAAVVPVVALAACYGGGIELLQGLTPSRSLSGADAMANAIGAVVGGGLWVALGRPVPTRVRRQSEQ